ncbi:MAG: type IV-A pilus assembly ATPase PilB [Thiofilum sp.]|uniref:type IV-A pilus assembly ATPase PilB n=1 Tax=Thiofilum sp. TaxID=2212733 RepID=UPI0025EA37F1|nr:type IV-A pilus assembly ATPase PilB [Thiofilum sp.]MBK8452410.1 type IV-A pilus assembly ATPase PilB [Thiofilum sp.]
MAIKPTVSTNTNSPKPAIPGFIRQLIKLNATTEEQALEIVTTAKAEHITIMAQMIKMRITSPILLAKAASLEYGLSYVDLDAINIGPDVFSLISDEQKQRLNLLPLYRMGQRLFVAIADPAHLPHMDDVKFATGLTPDPVFVEYNKLNSYLHHSESLAAAAASGDNAVINTGMMISNEAIIQNIALDTQELRAKNEGEEVEIVSFVDKLLVHAITSKVSDIHIEPYEKTLRIRFRIDGMLQVIATPPIDIATKLVARIKVMARMNISERRIPQDGRIRITLKSGKDIDFRVNTLPVLHGEKVVMRILDSANATLGVDKLGFDAKQKADFMNALSKPDGMILVTGPTGSGKTVTLYTGLGILNTPEKNISTAEDPAEINMPGINQVNVNPKVGLTFADALRSFLRQDPDIIMVGEIRDLETAEIAIKAAQTGHLVLSTLHTNSAPEALTRLMNMGVAPFNIATSVHLIIAQRLARRLCDKCKRPHDLPQDVLLGMGFKPEELSILKVYKAIGCDVCSNGYKGRVGIYQVMPISPAMARIVMDGGNSMDLAEQAQREGVVDLRQAGLNKIRAGLTTLEEIERVTKD